MDRITITIAIMSISMRMRDRGEWSENDLLFCNFCHSQFKSNIWLFYDWIVVIYILRPRQKWNNRDSLDWAKCERHRSASDKKEICTMRWVNSCLISNWSMILRKINKMFVYEKKGNTKKKKRKSWSHRVKYDNNKLTCFGLFRLLYNRSAQHTRR